MFRGFENILRGRDPLDAQHITQRICGVCPVSHGTASILAQDDAFGLQVPDSGRILRNLVLGANYIQSHILHFYHLAALDFVDIAAILQYEGRDPQLLSVKSWVQQEVSSGAIHPAAPFLPRYEGQYLQDTDLNVTAIKHYLDALEMRTLAHRMGSIFAGKLPHAMTLTPGGVTEQVTALKIASYRSMLDQLRSFIDHCYIEDVLAVAPAFPDYFATGAGCANFLSYGVFQNSAEQRDTFLPSGVVAQGQLQTLNPHQITEDVRHSHFSSTSGLHPSEGRTEAAPQKSGSYSWLKAPRYQGEPMEVGPLARMVVAYHEGSVPQVKTLVDAVLQRVGGEPKHLPSVLGRHAARAIECKVVADKCAEWLDGLRPGQVTCAEYEIPKQGQGVGLTEAPRGALGHWITIDDHKIESYQCIVPTTWNCSPRDDRGVLGPVEQALVGTPVVDAENPLEAGRVVRSFDPCIACAVH